MFGINIIKEGTQMKIKVVLDEGALMPTKAHDNDAGFDLYSREDKIIPNPSSSSIFGSPFSFCKGNSATFDTGVHIEIPKGYVGFLKSKSGLNVKSSLLSDGVIDSGYTGSIVVKLYNHGSDYYQVRKGDKITQLVILPIPEVELEQSDLLDESDRGNNGFGSTGR